MKINVIGVPLYFGCDREGVDLSPNLLRKHGLIEILEKHHEEVYDLGNIYVEFMEEKEKFSSHKSMKYLNPIVNVNKNLAHSVYSSLSTGSFPLVIGGDHALGLGSLSGCSKAFGEDLAVIWIDAHGDINTHTSSPSGNVHGMPLASAMGEGPSDLTNLYFKGRKINPKNVYIVGARDLDKGELKLIEDLNLSVWTTSDVKKEGCKNVVDSILKDINSKGITNVHLSYDIDSLDAALVPGTGTPVSQGLYLDEVNDLLKNLLSSGFIKSMDFVELNTKIDKEDSTLRVALELLDTISSSLK
ncbi:arginase [Clostridium sp.]|uniref:arginase n=1 Tax=Clostridium sp. TaxID=1506 RepID=UPI0034645868